MSDQELVEFLEGQKWASLIASDPVVKQLAEKIRSHVTGEGQGDDLDDEELVNCPRMKLVVVGDGAVGKTSLLIRFAKGEFPEDYLPTVFENYTAKHKTGGKTVLLHLWDTAGQEDYDRLRPLSYPGADVVLLCYNTISQASFEAIQEKWAPEIEHYIKDCPKILVGTKVDLRAAEAVDPNSGTFDPIKTADGERLAKELGATFAEISAKTNQGLTELFEKAIEIAFEHSTGAGAGAASAVGSRRKAKKSTCLLL